MKANRLASEKSPYLRQHGANPVDWHPWGQEAFDLARREDKPILLSVGYSACHWCHVMAHESFENPEIARVMNANFVNIKVDREEHPDVDQVYQSVVQMLTRSGGWPLTVFLTPDLKPYFGGTYYPPEDRWGRPGFPRLLEAMERAYREQREDVEENARRLLEAMGTMEAGAESPAPGVGAGPGLLETLRQAALKLTDYTDWEHGGFGGAPKFPNPMALSFLFRAGAALGLDRSRQSVILALTRMAEGGIYDQLGGGFHRYSVDERWAVPHFEKMLYDNALLLRLYSEVLLGAPELDAGVRSLFTDVLVETAEYVLREMTSAHGAFWTAQDADSEGEEGRFFVWDPHELARILSPSEARVFALRYGVTEQGNFEHQKTVLSLCMELGGIASETGLTEAEVRENLAFACSKLRAIRERRVAPGLDDKILVSWNGLMVSGLAWASRALECEGHAALSHRTSIAAHRALDWIASSAAMGESGRIWAVLDADGEARIPGRLDDSAFLARGALDLLRFLRPEAMARKGALLKSLAVRLVEDAIGRFMDPGTGSFYLVDPQRSDLVQRPRSSHDQAIPAGASVLLDCWMELRELGMVRGREAEYPRCLEALVPALERSPMGVAEGASVLLKHAIGPVVIKGEGSLALQGHFAVLQDGPASPGGRLQFCQRQACSEATAGELSQRLVPGLQSPPR